MLIDFHTHILPASFAARREELAARDATFAAILSRPRARIAAAPELIAAMDRHGIAHSVVIGIGWTDPAVAREANDCIIEAVSEHPGRLTGFCSVNPAWGDAALAEVERCAAAGLRGIGELHPDTQGADITRREDMAPLMDLARELGMPVLLHASEPVGHQYPGKGRTTPDKVFRLIANFPENVIICAHWGGGLPFYALMPEVAAALGNVYFDTAASPFLYAPEVYSTVSSLVGPDRILFASDFPLMEQSRPLAQVTALRLPPEDEESILGGNAARLLGLSCSPETR